MKIAIIGVTGLVGTEMLRLLEEFGTSVAELIPVASERSVGKTISFKGQEFTIIDIDSAIQKRPDFALFSAGGQTSLTHAPRFAEVGTIVIDNSSAWRMHKSVPLVVTEINLHTIGDSRIIANPNCSTIQMVMALAPLHKAFVIKRLVIATYQSVSGTGKAALDQLQSEKEGTEAQRVYPHPIEGNCIPQCDVFTDNDYTKEEMKMVNETRKILADDTIRITATCARVPVRIGHSEAINIEFERDFEIQSVKNILKTTKGIIVMDDNQQASYPTPLFAEGKNEVFVGRIRRDDSLPSGLNLWIVADNLRKGAATNAVQIVNALVKRKVIT